MTSTLRLLLSDIKVSHTIFAMPFALLGAFMAASMDGAIEWNAFTGQLLLIIGCMFFARNFAMLSNRITDSGIDAHNPRTQNRVIASGKVSVTKARWFQLLNIALFVICTYGFAFFWDNWLPLQCSLLVLVWLFLYAYMKRFTWLCHVYLGSSLALSPICAAVAIDPSLLSSASIWLLSAAVMCWVAGFDIIYALQDVDIDKRDKLKSMPASLGVKPAMLISQFLHAISVACLFGVAAANSKLGYLFLSAVIFIALLLIVEHMTVKKWGTTKIALTFFTLNGIVSIALGTSGIVDLLM